MDDGTLDTEALCIQVSALRSILQQGLPKAGGPSGDEGLDSDLDGSDLSDGGAAAGADGSGDLEGTADDMVMGGDLDRLLGLNLALDLGTGSPVDSAEGGFEDDVELGDDDDLGSDLDLDSDELSEEEEATDSIELPPGTLLVPGSRLARLYHVLEANQALQQNLKTALTKVERLIDRNWRDTVAMTRMPSDAAQVAQGTAPGHEQQADGAGAMGSQGHEEGKAPPGRSRYWRINGASPPVREEAAEVAALIQQLPISFDRTRWSRQMSDLLKMGVLNEVQTLLTERALQRFDSLAKEGAGPAAGMTDLRSEFDRIKGLALDSPEAQQLVSELGPEQWARVSKSFVKDRSGLDCRAFYLHHMAPQRPWALEESRKLRSLVEANKEHHWDRVASDLGTGRTAAQCLQHYVKFSRPQHLRQRVQWSAEDDQELRAMVEQFGTNWVRISKEMGHRFDRHQLRDRWHGQTQRQHMRNTGRWEAAEDQRLLQAVQVHGFKWPAIALAVQTRTAQQCRERYNNVLDPKIKTEPFTDAEKERVRRACEEQLKAHGRIVWAQVAKLFPGRTDEAVRRIWRWMDTGTKSKYSTRKTVTDPQGQEEAGSGQEDEAAAPAQQQLLALEAPALPNATGPLQRRVSPGASGLAAVGDTGQADVAAASPATPGEQPASAQLAPTARKRARR